MLSEGQQDGDRKRGLEVGEDDDDGSHKRQKLEPASGAVKANEVAEEGELNPSAAAEASPDPVDGEKKHKHKKEKARTFSPPLIAILKVC